MGTAERRLEILQYLCRCRKATMSQLAERFGVSVRTVQRDIFEIGATFHVPLDVRRGKYDGGVYVLGDYSFDRAYMHEDELHLLEKVRELVKNCLSDRENAILSRMIRTYSRPA